MKLLGVFWMERERKLCVKYTYILSSDFIKISTSASLANMDHNKQDFRKYLHEDRWQLKKKVSPSNWRSTVMSLQHLVQHLQCQVVSLYCQAASSMSGCYFILPSSIFSSCTLNHQDPKGPPMVKESTWARYTRELSCILDHTQGRDVVAYTFLDVQ